MIFDDLYSQENALSADLDQFIRLVKNQEEDFLQIDTIIAKILYYRAQIENSIYIHDEIIQYKHLIQQQQLKLQNYHQRSQILYQRTHNSPTITDRTNILLKRATHRTLQNISHTLNQSSHKSGPLTSKFNQLKFLCQKILSDSNQGKFLQLIRAVGQFSQQKLLVLIRTFKEIAVNLENGQVQEFQKFRCFSFEMLNNQTGRQEKSIKQRKKIGCLKIEINSKPSAQKASSANQEGKDNDHNRFHLFTKAKKVMDNIKNVMEFNRQDFIEAFIEVCSENKDKILKQLRARNEANQRQITAFIQKNPRKRCRKMSSQQFMGQKKAQTSQQIDKHGRQKSENNQSTCYTARKSLLLKFKENEYRQKTPATQFYRKLSRVEEFRQKGKFMRKKSSGEIEPKDRQKKNAIIKAIQKIICENEELKVKNDLPVGVGQQRLPPLNKRAMSVDQNYATQEAKQSDLNGSRMMIWSIMQVQAGGKNNRCEKGQLVSGKSKIDSTNLRTFVQHEVNSKLISLTNMNKQVWF